MNCLGCNYALVGITAGACPECGRAFDPDDSSAFCGERERAHFRTLRLIHLATTMMPLLGLVSIAATWIIASSSLGRWPRPMFDDPGSIPGIGWWYSVSGTLLEIGCFTYFASVVLMLPLASMALQRRAWFALALHLALTASPILWVIIDPFEIQTWYFD